MALQGQPLAHGQDPEPPYHFGSVAEYWRGLGPYRAEIPWGNI